MLRNGSVGRRGENLLVLILLLFSGIIRVFWLLWTWLTSIQLHRSHLKSILRLQRDRTILPLLLCFLKVAGTQSHSLRQFFYFVVLAGR
jgi:hypothetical protein